MGTSQSLQTHDLAHTCALQNLDLVEGMGLGGSYQGDKGVSEALIR